MTEKIPGSARIEEYIERLTGMINGMKALPPEKQNPLLIFLLEALRERDERVLDACATGKPWIVSWYGNLPEISDSMGIVDYNPISDIFFHLGVTNYADAYELDKLDFDPHVCTLIRYGLYAMEKNLMPRPTAFVAMAEPCDGQLMIHQSWEKIGAAAGAPVYQLDPTYGTTEADYRYIAEQLRELIRFYEKHCGVKYSFEKLKAVVDETNVQYDIWKQVNALMAASPAPLPSFAVTDAFWYLMQHLIPCGDKRVTNVMRSVLEMAKKNVENHVGPVMNEQIRIYWPDLDPLWDNELGQWLAEEWGATVVGSFTGLTPYEWIDTSTEESTLIGLAKRGTTEVPMIRQGRGYVPLFTEDLTREVQNLNANCVIFPGHMGHKDQSGIAKFLRDACRDLDVPVLSMTTDLYDIRYTGFDKIKNDISNFLSVHGWKSVKKQA